MGALQQVDLNLGRLLQLPPQALPALLLVFIRCGGLFVTAPVLNAQQVPVRAKVGLAALVALVLFPVVAHQKLPALNNLGDLLVAVASELAVGLTIGFIARLFFDGVQFAGHTLGVQMGFGMSAMVDPMTRSQSSAVAIFLALVATMVFLLSNGHHWLLLAVAKSFNAVPPGTFNPTGGIMDHILGGMASLFDVAFVLLLPFMGLLLVADVAMGIASRVVPQMNILANSFPLKIGLGFVSLAIAMPAIANHLEVLMQQHMIRLLKLI